MKMYDLEEDVEVKYIEVDKCKLCGYSLFPDSTEWENIPGVIDGLHYYGDQYFKVNHIEACDFCNSCI